MSAKVAVIIGDYSNGWSDSIIVQHIGNFATADIRNDRDAVSDIMNNACISVVQLIESNEHVCPKPKDEPCCKIFESWAKRMKEKLNSDDLAELSSCPHCATKITPERRKKFFE